MYRYMAQGLNIRIGFLRTRRHISSRTIIIINNIYINAVGMGKRVIIIIIITFFQPIVIGDAR